MGKMVRCMSIKNTNPEVCRKAGTTGSYTANVGIINGSYKKNEKNFINIKQKWTLRRVKNYIQYRECANI